MSLLDKVKKRYYCRKFGAERAALILKVEREIAKLPKGAIYREWTEWLWALPEEAWLDAVALQGDRTEMMAKREIAVQAITRKNRLFSMVQERDRYGGKIDIDDLGEKLEAAIQEVERMKIDLGEQEKRVAERTDSFLDRFGSRVTVQDVSER